jgi:hypothetical protein
LQWSAFDDRAIVKQKILFSANENLKENFNVIANNLPPGQRSFEFTMPNVGGSGGSHKVIRVVAVDEKGQEGWDEWQLLVPRGTEPGVLQITTPVAGQTFRGGSELQLNLSGGVHTLTARAFDNLGAATVSSEIPRQLAAGSPIRKYGSPEGTLFPLVKGGVNTPTAK